MAEDQVMTPSETAKHITVSTITLKKWRALGRGPRFIRLTKSEHGKVRYRLSDVNKFLAENMVDPAAPKRIRRSTGQTKPGSR